MGNSKHSFRVILTMVWDLIVNGRKSCCFHIRETTYRFFFFFKPAYRVEGRKEYALCILTTTLGDQYYHPGFVNEGVEVEGSRNSWREAGLHTLAQPPPCPLFLPSSTSGILCGFISHREKAF